MPPPGPRDRAPYDDQLPDVAAALEAAQASLPLAPTQAPAAPSSTGAGDPDHRLLVTLLADRIASIERMEAYIRDRWWNALVQYQRDAAVLAVRVSILWGLTFGAVAGAFVILLLTDPLFGKSQFDPAIFRPLTLLALFVAAVGLMAWRFSGAEELKTRYTRVSELLRWEGLMLSQRLGPYRKMNDAKRLFDRESRESDREARARKAQVFVKRVEAIIQAGAVEPGLLLHLMTSTRPPNSPTPGPPKS